LEAKRVDGQAILNNDKRGNYFMKPAIIGIRHTPNNLKEIAEAIHKEAARAGKEKVVIGIEASASAAKETLMWRELARALERNPKIKIEFLGSKFAEDTATKGMQNEAKALSKMNLYEDFPNNEEMKKSRRNTYLITTLRENQFLRKAARAHADIMVLGGVHAYNISQRLKVAPKYVGCNAREVEEYALSRRSAATEVMRERKQIKILRKRVKARARISRKP